MIKNIKVVDIPISKPKRSAKEVVNSVRRDEAIPRGDVGAYLVGVFYCQPLTPDGKNYDLLRNGQGKLCIYRAQWNAALHGKDEFTEEDKSLILAGVTLLKDHRHLWVKKASSELWGDRAIEQPHVRKLLESWRNSNQGTSATYDVIDSGNSIPSVDQVDEAIAVLRREHGTVNDEILKPYLEKQMLTEGHSLDPDWWSEVVERHNRKS